ncbi:MAG: hypothetical protein H6978_08600 [Gammaproteobacteria bacterium]|nr:hypothetical protein [Gammaproteobacteria bacterium]
MANSQFYVDPHTANDTCPDFETGNYIRLNASVVDLLTLDSVVTEINSGARELSGAEQFHAPLKLVAVSYGYRGADEEPADIVGTLIDTNNRGFYISVSIDCAEACDVYLKPSNIVP